MATDEVSENVAQTAIKTCKEFFRFLLPDLFQGRGKITDINKSSGTLKLNLFGVYSNNIPDTAMVTVKKVLEAKYAGVIGELITEIMVQAHMAGRNPLGDVYSKLSNKGYKVVQSNAADKLDEMVLQVQDIVSRVVFNESSLSGFKLNEAKAGGESSSSANGTIFTIPLILKDGNPLDSTQEGYAQEKIQFKVDVSLMTVEAEKVIEAIGTSKDRSNLFNYMKMRAGASGFFKDFVLNLKEIDKEVARDTSDSLSDRLLASMMRRGGFLTPMAFSDIEEAKYFLLVLEQCDADTLKSQYGFDISKPGTLQLIFKRFNILSLVLVDNMKKNIVMHDSDNPLKSTIYNYESGGNSDQMASLFAALARK